MVNVIPEGETSVTGLLLMAASMVPASHYLVSLLLLFAIFLYNFLEFHILGDFLRGFRGDPVILTFNPASKIYEDIISKCRILHGRYLATPWLSSPHFQTTFLNFFGRPPVFAYRRQLFSVHDGGTIALDWLLASDVAGSSLDNNTIICEDNTTPIAVIVPGLTSDSASPYVKHIVYKMAKRGWNVVVGNHRGLGGVSLTSDRFYNAGWTEDVREVVNYLNQKYPKVPIFAIGTSIGANILVKYLGEEGEKTPIAGAASICSPWDLVVCDRFICRKLVQRLYDRALTIGLQGYAKLHQPVLTRLANWDGIWESRSVRDFDHHATCYVGKFETVDTYYRCCSSAGYVGNVSVPLLCIGALDDPVCTREAIPWDECRANKNIILATTTHGGHLAYFEGITASSVWWVKAVDEFLAILHSSPYMHGQKLENQEHYCPLESSIDKSPYVNIMEDGFVAATRSDGSDDESVHDPTDEQIHLEAVAQTTSAIAMDQIGHGTREDTSMVMLSKPSLPMDQIGHDTKEDTTMVMLSKPSLPMEQKDEKDGDAGIVQDVSSAAVRRCLKQLSRQSRKSMWLLVCIAIMSSWPLVGSVLLFIFRNKLKGILPETMRGRKK